ncbi:phosphatase PAP2 family protein [Phyllobacterium sp. 22552]|uniref:phosphatase PAP2 family protein n=1 Tax=Phyllobacterium sp. 22552 TaxID=3453941 RepID=UPI003F877E06
MADTSSIAQRLNRSLARYLHVVTARPHPDGAAAWTRSMSMAVALIVFLVLSLHPYDEYLSRMFTSPDSDLRNLRLITDIGLSKWYVIPAFIIIVCLIAIDWQHLPVPRRKRLHLAYTQATYAFWAISLAGTCTAIAKFFIGRARPPFIDTLGTGHFSPFAGGDDLASFPSGHSTTMGAVGAILALWFPRWRLPIILATMFIAFTRIVAQAHYPTDTVAGYSIGFLVAITLARFLARRHVIFRCERGRFFPVIGS